MPKNTEIRFYHLENMTVEHALPALLQKALQTGKRSVVKTSDPRRVQNINESLWTQNPNNFIPHGTEKEGFAARQPIWITNQDENPNDADVLVLIDDAECALTNDFSLCCILFNGQNHDILNATRTRWKTYKEQGLSITYWQQGPQGWEKKAEENQEAA